MSVVPETCAVKIAVRERPVNTESIVAYDEENRNILIVDERRFYFDHVFNGAVTQTEIFEDLMKPMITKVLKGFNCTALAYGQTGTGKSYTMGLNTNGFEGDSIGFVPRCLSELFNAPLNGENASENIAKRNISVSFIEIYNEKVYDLLGDNQTDPIVARGYKYTGGVRKTLNTLEDSHRMLIQGNKNRHVRPTKMNSQSSRSHAIFTIHVNSIESVQNGRVIRSSFTLVDLAGSEGVRRTGHQGLAMSEGVHINQGLLSIGKVLQAMTLGSKVIPYRDSVLSSVLQDSLNPNSYLTLLACISPQRQDISETISTLRFAQNAKQLKHVPQMNAMSTEKDRKIHVVKTPFKVNGLSNKSSAAPTTAKRQYSNTTIRYDSSTGRRNTFCTPNKLKRLERQKLNRTEMDAVAAKAHKTLFQPRDLQQINTRVVRKTQDSSFDQTMDSAASLISMNISSSTAIDAPSIVTNKNYNYSPIMRKYMAEFETRMESKICQVLDHISSIAGVVNKDKSNCSTSLTAGSTILYTPFCQNIAPCERGTAINEQEKDAQKNCIPNESESLVTKTAPTNENVRCQLEKKFATSSPIFKVPEVPSKRNAVNISNSDSNSLLSLTLAEENRTCTQASFVDPTVMSVTTLRRSRRISGRVQNKSLNCDTANRSRNVNKSTKCMQEERRRSIRLAAHLEMPEKKTRNSRTKQSSKQKAMDLDNSVICSYFNNNDNNNAMKTTNTSLAKHRKAILELLNTGSMKHLQVLPQIGQKTAYQIVTQRTLNGKFRSLSQVEKLPIWRGNAWERFAKANILL